MLMLINLLGKQARQEAVCGHQDGGPIRGRSHLPLLVEPAHGSVDHDELLANPQNFLVKIPGQGLGEGGHGGEGTERPTNMLTLSPTVHRLWGGCFFALKPVRVVSKRKMVVEFHWLQPRPKAKKQLMVNARIRPDCLAEVDSPGQDIRLLHSPSKTIITSGTRIAIRTDDPRKRPLPSFALLQMQWNLQRVAALSATAEWREEDCGDSDDDDATDRESVCPFWDVDYEYDSCFVDF